MTWMRNVPLVDKRYKLTQLHLICSSSGYQPVRMDVPYVDTSQLPA